MQGARDAGGLLSRLCRLHWTLGPDVVRPVVELFARTVDLSELNPGPFGKAHVHQRQSVRSGSTGSAPLRTRRPPFQAPLFFLCSLVFARRTAGHAEAQGIVPAPHLVPVAVRRPADPSPVVPAPAPDHPERVFLRTCRIPRVSTLVSSIPIPAPLKNVSMHVGQAPAVRAKTYGS